MTTERDVPRREPVWRRYLRVLGPDTRADLEDELAHHLAMRIAEYRAAGLSPADAERAARDRLGDVESVRRRCGDIARLEERRERRHRRVSGLRQDLRFAGRVVRGAPGYAAIAVVTIALGIGATATMFAVVQAVVLRPLPIRDASRVVAIDHFNRETGTGDFWSSFPQFLDYESENRTFSHIAAWRQLSPTLRSTDGRPPLRVRATGVTHSMFDLLGVAAEWGRTFSPADEDPASPRTAILGHAFWRSWFGGSPDALGRTIDLDGEPFAVVGILPSTFRGNSVPPADTDIWLPYRNSPAVEGVELRGLTNVNVVARLADGVPMGAARADVERMATVLAAEHAEHAVTGGRVTPVRNVVVGRAGGVMILLFGAVGLVLLIAATNVTNLLLGRTADRAREIAVRTALGASRRRIVRLIVAESLLLAALGTASGVALSLAGLRIVTSLDPGSIPRLESATLSPLVAAFVFAVMLLLAIGVGLAPALHATGRGHRHAIGTGGRGAPGGRERLRRSLVVCQVAAATILLVAAGLMLRSLSEALSVDPGFEPAGVLTARVTMPGPFVSPDWPRHVAFFRELVARLEERPDVEAAAAAYMGPTDPGWHNGFRILGAPEPPAGQQPNAVFRPITPGYFETVGTRLLRGRTLEASDRETAPGAVVVNEAFVRRFLPDRDPLGVRLDYGDFWGSRDPEYEIVGVVEDVLFYGPDQPTQPATYFAHAQQPVKEMSLFVRSASDAASLTDAVRVEVGRLDPTLPVDGVTTLAVLSRSTVADRRFLMIVFASFASIAVVLAATGLYGVLTFLVGRRTREIGVRLALGARRPSVLTLVLRQAGALVAIGLALGVAGALALSRLLRGLLYGIGPSDPATVITTIAGLLLVALVASAGPALRATRLDPARTLRAE